MTTETEVGVTHAQAKECQPLPEAERQGMGLSQSLQRKCNPADALIQ